MTMTHHPPRWRIALVREAEAPSFTASTFRTSHDVADAFRFLADHDREEFWLVALDVKHRIIATHQLSVGSLTTALVSPREAAKLLVLCSAAAALMVHNHPSGTPDPSSEDRVITERLVRVGELLGIAVLDHVIIGHGRHYSFADAAELPTTGRG